MTDAEVLTGFQRLVASLRDSHTTLWLAKMQWKHVVPLVLSWFEDGFYVIRAHRAYEPLLGGKVRSIDGMPAGEVYRRFAELAPAENEVMRREGIGNMMRLGELLAGTGVVKSPERITVEVTHSGGAVSKMEVALVNLRELGAMSSLTKVSAPLYESRRSKAYWFQEIEDGSVLYFHYARCVDDPAEPMAEFRLKLREAMGRQGLRRLVVDLRLNTGGNSSILDPLIDDIKQSRFNAKGRLAVIIGPKTMSSGLLNAMRLRLETRAVIVGEPTAGKPNHFGDVRELILPNSKLPIMYSTKYFERLKGRDPESMFPDVAAPVRFEDYRDGKDPALEAALRF